MHGIGALGRDRKDGTAQPRLPDDLQRVRDLVTKTQGREHLLASTGHVCAGTCSCTCVDARMHSRMCTRTHTHKQNFKTEFLFIRQKIREPSRCDFTRVGMLLVCFFSLSLFYHTPSPTHLPRRTVVCAAGYRRRNSENGYLFWCVEL